MTIGPLYVASALFLGFVVAFVFSLVESDSPREVAKATIRRAAQLYGLIFGLGLIVMVLDWM
ncbi:MAG: hypothetical protein Kow0059_03090 [Candidatus Sumerlaeia bacterium]